MNLQQDNGTRWK